MKVCTKTHDVVGFGTVPAGSLWADDSPYVVDADCFVEVHDEKPAAAAVKPVRKLGQKGDR